MVACQSNMTPLYKQISFSHSSVLLSTRNNNIDTLSTKKSLLISSISRHTVYSTNNKLNFDHNIHPCELHGTALTYEHLCILCIQLSNADVQGTPSSTNSVIEFLHFDKSLFVSLQDLNLMKAQLWSVIFLTALQL